jgi:adenylyltransferase/sulfurtransferase
LNCAVHYLTLVPLHSAGRPSLLIFSALSVPPFRSAKLRNRRPTCPACGDEAKRVGRIEEIDYVAFCGGYTPDFEATGLKPDTADHRVRGKVCAYTCIECMTRALKLRFVQDLQEAVASGGARIIDVRSPTEFGICHLPTSTSAYSLYSSCAFSGMTLPQISRCPSLSPTQPCTSTMTPMFTRL